MAQTQEPPSQPPESRQIISIAILSLCFECDLPCGKRLPDTEFNEGVIDQINQAPASEAGVATSSTLRAAYCLVAAAMPQE